MLLIRIVLLLAVASFASGVSAADVNASDASAEANWKLVSDKNGIQVYRRTNDTARINTFRGVTRFSIANPASIEALLNDYAAIPRWMHFISKGEEFSRKSYMERKMRFTTELPWPLSDRDVVADFIVHADTPTDWRIDAVDDPSSAITPDYVRIPDLKGRLEFLFFPATKEVEATYEVVMNPGGYIPAWATNIILKDTPYFTLLKLRRILAEQKYQQFHGSTFTQPW